MTGRRFADLALGVLGIAFSLAAWQVIGAFGLAGLTWPPLTDVLAYLVDPAHRPLLGRALASTLVSVAWGYGVGMTVGLGLRRGATGALGAAGRGPAGGLRPRHPGDRAGAAVHRAVEPRGNAGGGGGARRVLRLLRHHHRGVRGRDRRPSRRAGRAGGRAVASFALLAVPAAVPAMVTGAKLAVPAALIGAILGEWFGAPRGLGVLMVSAMQNFQISLLWAVVLLASALSLLLFRLGAMLERAAYGRFR